MSPLHPTAQQAARFNAQAVAPGAVRAGVPVSIVTGVVHQPSSVTTYSPPAISAPASKTAPGGAPIAQATPAERAATQPAPTPLDSTLVYVADIVVEGSTVYTAADFQTHTAPYRGKPVSLRQLQQLAQELSNRYRAAGYVLSKVVLPDQSMQNGVVRLKAQEGYIARIHVDGMSQRKRKAFDGALAALKRARPLTAAALERNLLLINDLAGVTAAATLAPIDHTAHQLSLRVKERRYAGSVGVSNLGSRSRGALRAQAEVEVYSLLGGFDRMRVRTASSGNREQNSAAARYETPLGANGMTVGVEASGVNARPGRSRKANRNLETRSRDLVADLRYPVVRSRGKNLQLKASLSAHDGAIDLPGLARTEDKIRALRVGARYDWVDSLQGVNELEVELSQGLDALGASKHAAGLSREGGRTDFTKLTVQAARLQALREQWSLLGAINAQYALHDLLVPERFTFGGEHFGRGYDVAEIAGDHGAAMKLELRYSGTQAQSVLNAYTLYGFYDAGKVWQRNPAADEKASASAAAAGLGARMNFGVGTSAFVTVAKPLTREVAEEGDKRARFFAGASYQF